MKSLNDQSYKQENVFSHHFHIRQYLYLQYSQTPVAIAGHEKTARAALVKKEWNNFSYDATYRPHSFRGTHNIDGYVRSAVIFLEAALMRKSLKLSGIYIVNALH